MSSLLEQGLVCYSIADTYWKQDKDERRRIVSTCYNLHHCMEYCLEFLLELTGNRANYEYNLSNHIKALKSYGMQNPLLDSIDSLSELYCLWESESYLHSASGNVNQDIAKGFKVCDELIEFIESKILPL